MTTTPPLSPERFEAVEAHVRRLVAEGDLPHAQLLAARDGEVLHGFTMGAAREGGEALRQDALFRIASMSKAVTAVAFLMLVECEQVRLDDSIAGVLPELENLQVYENERFFPFKTRSAARQPVMLDLLLHTAGFTHGFQQHHPVDQAYWTAGVDNFKAVKTADGIVAALAKLPLVHEPGAAFTYSIATDLIGIIIERVLDRPLDAILAERIFRPLGMVDTGFVLRADQANRFTDAWAMHPRRGRYVYDRADGGLWSRPLTFASGGGGLLSTTADYHRFCRMLLGQGALEGERLLKPETMALMMRNHLPDGGTIGAMARGMFSGAAYRDVGQGLGIAVTLPGGAGPRPAGELHWSGLFSTFYSVVPSERTILTFMTQLMPLTESDLPNAIYRILLGEAA